MINDKLYEYSTDITGTTIIDAELIYNKDKIKNDKLNTNVNKNVDDKLLKSSITNSFITNFTLYIIDVMMLKDRKIHLVGHIRELVY